ncbi:MAG: hypothetical protein ACOCSM_01790 [Bacillota bacterium]
MRVPPSRDSLPISRKRLRTSPPSKKQIGDYHYLVYGILQKEQPTLFPVAVKVLDLKTMDAMYEEAFEYGFVFIERTPPQYEGKRRRPISRTASLSVRLEACRSNRLN